MLDDSAIRQAVAILTAPRRMALALVTLSIFGSTATATTLRVRFSDRVDAYSRKTHSMWVGMHDHSLLLRGDGDTDIDCFLYDEDNDLVARDIRPTDECEMSTLGYGRHRLVVRNLGEVYNRYTVDTRNY
jgi:hypothetical protein